MLLENASKVRIILLYKLRIQVKLVATSISVAFVKVPITPYVSKVGNIDIAQPTYATANHHIIAWSHLPINYTSNVPNYTLFLWLGELFILSRDRKKIVLLFNH